MKLLIFLASVFLLSCGGNEQPKPVVLKTGDTNTLCPIFTAYYEEIDSLAEKGEFIFYDANKRYVQHREHCNYCDRYLNLCLRWMPGLRNTKYFEYEVYNPRDYRRKP